MNVFESDKLVAYHMVKLKVGHWLYVNLSSKEYVLVTGKALHSTPFLKIEKVTQKNFWGKLDRYKSLNYAETSVIREYI